MKVKKVLPLLALALVVAIMVMGAVGSGAWFTDQETVAVQAEAGDLDFVVSSTPISIANAEPGEWYGPYVINVYNNQSTMPIKYRFTADESSGSTALFNKLVVRADSGYAPFPGGFGFGVDDFTGPLSTMSIDSPTYAVPSMYLGVNITHVWAFYFKVDESAGNDLQGAAVDFDVVVDGTQVGNPGWAE